MAGWILVPCLVQLRAEFDAIAPGRSTASDGSIGDAAHQAEVSDHNPDEVGSVPVHDADSINEVHAIDVTSAGPWPPMTSGPGSMEKIVQFLVDRCRSGAEKRLRYIIFNRRIWSATYNWEQQSYTGASSHEEHAHFSASYQTAHEASTASWHLEDLVALTADDKEFLRQLWSDAHGKVVARWTDKGTQVPATDPAPTQTPAAALFYIGAATKRIENAIAELDAKIDADDAADVLARLTPDELAAAFLKAGLSPAEIAAGIPAEIAQEVADELEDRLPS